MSGKGLAEQEQDATEGVVEGPRPSASFANYVQRLASAELPENRSADVANSQLDRMLVAETLDDIMDSDEQGTLQARELVGFEFEVTDFDFNQSIHKSDDKYNAALGVYIQFPATALMEWPDKGVSVGERVLISTGAPLIIGKLRTLQANGYLPMKLKISGTDAPNGTVLKLRRAPVR